MKLFFEDYDCGIRRLVGECHDEQAATALLCEDLSQIQFESDYLRSWRREGTDCIVYDFGSHTKFYVLQP